MFDDEEAAEAIGSLKRAEAVAWGTTSVGSRAPERLFVVEAVT